ncbi:hypothetical protein GGE67_005479 [Rhizobium leucaenae]|uniref:Uncharacterized protein n=1 Tax=Rhizobium leucaenae TaxID=29450 RepID=A0A7W7A0E3_9HYPH|nr:hypothetical protein [Rhizobium leucaenae]MBB6304819.1 hypothetical protein [Rhizobium leucaenae]
MSVDQYHGERTPHGFAPAFTANIITLLLAPKSPDWNSRELLPHHIGVEGKLRIAYGPTCIAEPISVASAQKLADRGCGGFSN